MIFLVKPIPKTPKLEQTFLPTTDAQFQALRVYANLTKQSMQRIIIAAPTAGIPGFVE